MHVQAKLDTDRLNVLETFLVVRTGATDPDVDVVLDEERCDFTDGADDTLECGCDLSTKVSWLLP